MTYILLLIGAGMDGPVMRGSVADLVSKEEGVRPYTEKKVAALQLSDHLIPRTDAQTDGSGWNEYSPFFPMDPGDGWIPPSGVITDPGEDNWTPMIAVDANGVLWCTENTFESEYYAAVGIYYSTDQGSTWNFRTYIVASVDLGDPVIAIDVQRNPNKMYVSFWADYDIGYFTFDISGTSLLNGTGNWLETSVNDVAGPSIAIIERGYTTNYAFIAWENNNGSSYQIRVARTTDYGASWTTSIVQSATNQYLGQVWGNAGNNTNPCVMITYKQNPNGTDWTQATRAVLAYSTNRGASYTTTTRDFAGSGYVFQTASAIGFGSNYVVWAIQVNPSSSDGNIFIRYSTDRCASWANEYYLENSPLSVDSRMPIVYADGMQNYNYTSQFFYIGFFRETIAGSGLGNYFFKMVPVSAATSAGNWVKPAQADSFAIANEAAYSVKEANWAQLHLTSFIRSGGYVAGLVWNHEASLSNHDIYFTRPLQPLYEDVKESVGPSVFFVHQLSGAPRGKLLLEIGLPSESMVSLTLYDATGRAALSDGFELGAGIHHIQKDIAGLSPGVYFLMVSAQMGEVIGKVMIR